MGQPMPYKILILRRVDGSPGRFQAGWRSVPASRPGPLTHPVCLPHEARP